MSVFRLTINGTCRFVLEFLQTINIFTEIAIIQGVTIVNTPAQSFFEKLQ